MECLTWECIKLKPEFGGNTKHRRMQPDLRSIGRRIAASAGGDETRFNGKSEGSAFEVNRGTEDERAAGEGIW